MIKYFVVYRAYTNDGQSITGNAVVIRKRKIKELEDIREVETEFMNKFNYTVVCITNFILL